MKHKTLIVGWLVFVAGAAGLARQTAAPLASTPSGRRVEAYIKSFNTGETAMKDFFAANAARDALQKTTMETRLTRYKQMRDRLGDLEIRRVAENKADLVSVVAHGSNGPIVNLDFQFEAAEPHGLLGVRVMDIGEEGGPPLSPKKDDVELAAAVDELVRKEAAADAFSGVVLLAKNGTAFHLQAVGDTDREKKIPNRTDTKFNLGSINKAFTGVAVRLLAAAGKIRLDDTIGTYLPDYPNAAAAAKVTIRQLLDMTSGVGDFFGERYEAAPKEKIRSLKDYLSLFADRPLEFEPGTRSRYSNGGYVVLGLIIEKAAGRDYYDYIRDNIFRPAGMFNTDWYAKDDFIANRAIGYMGNGPARKPNYDTLPGRGSSAGGGYSTAADLLKFTVALGNGLYDPAAADLKVGFGIAGGAPGLNAAVEFDPQRGYVIIVLANLDSPAAERLARQIRSWLPQ